MAKTSKPSLAETHPELAAQADGWDPNLVWAGSYKKMNWECASGHIWEATIANRSRNGTGCPVCLNRKVLIGLNDLATTNPELAKEVDGWDPTSVTAGSHKVMSWKCQLGHTWTAQLKNRSTIGTGCPVCSNRKVLIGFNDLATTNPELAKEVDGWDPTSVTAGSHKVMSWKCQLGHTWKTEIVVRNSGFKCPYCSNYKVLVGFNDLATTHPELSREADGWDPTSVIAGSHKVRSWICQLGHTWKAQPNNRSSSTSGCPSCADYGIDPNKETWLYFVENYEKDMYQIGITNTPKRRLGEHGKGGWEVIELRGPMDGQLTQKLEIDCLHALERRGAIFGHKAGIDKFDGYSEAWTKASLNVKSIKQILDWVYEDEGISNSKMKDGE
jgi:hypothetical protein